VVAAPPEIIPLESVNAEQMSDILDLARQEFSNVLVDLPGSWTNWSLSLVARADAICLITEMSIPSLRQARRQLDMLSSQDLGDLPIYVIVNRHERGFLKSIKTGEAEQALNHSIAGTISNDFRTLSAAIDQGVPVSDIRMKTRLEKDMSSMIDMLLTHIEQRE
jgi:pilus assembly protein CpaE